ncbi:MAG: hypothetical protein CMF86_01840 [Candidatus Marinimicrobia bacterium]|nr:hypothetical protein [Candidatus Neomarinimicrobiota bacterium]
MKKTFYSFIYITILLILSGCAGPGQFAFQQSWAERTLQKLTLREKIGQMMLYGMHMKFMNNENPVWQELKTIIETDGVGGIHLWSGDAGTSLTMLNELQRMSKIPILVDADIEHGMNQRYEAGTDLPPLMAIAATGDSSLAYEAARIKAIEGRAVGIHWNFSPVTDVNNNPANPIINVRSFGEDPDLVGKYAVEYIRGLQDHGMLATVKHFPGHGDTETDSHTSLARIPSDSTRLWDVEIKPFKIAIDAGADAVMVAHVHAPDLQPNADLPATLSKFWTTNVLKNGLGFKGVVVTDAMGMGGIARNYSKDFGLIYAINAGCDFIIQAHRVTDAIDVVERAVKEGVIAEKRINESALKMLKMKEKIGLHENRFISMEHTYTFLGKNEFKKSAADIASRALTLVKNNGGVLPLNKIDGELIVLDIYDHPNDHRESTMTKSLKSSEQPIRSFQIDESDSSDFLNSVLNQIPANGTVIVNAFASPQAHKDRIGLPAAENRFLKDMIKKVERLILVSFGNPYLIQDFPDLPVYVCAYKGNKVMQTAAAEAILGNVPINGKLPITIPDIADFGDGIDLQRSPLRVEASNYKPGKMLQWSMPYEVEAQLLELRKILEDAVADSAFPGGVLLAEKSGKIFFHEGVGFHTYAKKRPVLPADLYDLASLTKVVATTAAIMKLFDQKKITIDDRVVKYIPEFGTSAAKKTVSIQQLLTHHSGLPADKRYDLEGSSWEDVFKTDLIAEPGIEREYSDIGFLILGEIVKKVSGQNLNEYLKEFVYGPLGMESTVFNPMNPLRRIVPTEIDLDGNLIHGVVHDEKARYFGGNTGHAGLFSTARDLALFGQTLINGGIYGWKRVFREETVKLFTQTVQENGELFGWDQPGGFNPFGIYHSENTFGHTGFTGTSMWIDPENDIIVVLLTNAVHPSRIMKAPNYYDWGQLIHSAAYEAVDVIEQNPNLEWRERWK